MNLKHQHISSFISEPYLTRGKEYFQKGLVKISSISKTIVKARVAGSTVYVVTLILEGSCLDGYCSCPAFRDFGPCKHMAAVGLAVIEYQQSGVYRCSPRCTDQLAEFESFELALRRKTKKDLIAFIIELSSHYPDIVYELQE